MKYLGSLLLGGIRERQQQLDPAARTYLDGILAMPDGQSGYLALAHVMQAINQRDNASAVVERMFSRSIVNLAADPWWTYPLGLDTNLDPKFDEIRAEIRK